MKTILILAAFDFEDFIKKHAAAFLYIFFIFIISLMIYIFLFTKKFRKSSRPKPPEIIKEPMSITITITSDKPSLNINESSLISFALSSPSTDFTEKSIIVIGGEISIFSGSESFYSATFTPTDANLTSATIDVHPPLLKDPTGPLTIIITAEEPSPTIPESPSNKDLSPFINLKPPVGENSPSVIFHTIRSEMNELFNKARTKFDQGELGLIGSGSMYHRVLKLSQLNEFEKLTNKKITAFNESDKWYFIGDIHGDFLALHSILEEIKKDPNFKICFLGDLVDRGPYDAECFALLLKTIMDNPGKIIWILGNHDEGIQKTNVDILNEKTYFSDHLHSSLKEIQKCVPQFSSSVLPAEFLYWLNFDDPKVKKERVFCGKLFCDIVSVLPRAILFPNGLLATHGGFPLSDRWDSLTTMDAFLHKRCLTDFTWNRAANKKKSLISIAERPKQSSWEFGFDDLEKFCEKVKDLFPVKAVIRGHDHVKEGWENFDLYKTIPLLTLNSFGFNYQNNSLSEGQYKQNIVYYETSKDKILPDIRKLIPVDSNTHKEFYGQSSSL